MRLRGRRQDFIACYNGAVANSADVVYLDEGRRCVTAGGRCGIFASGGRHANGDTEWRIRIELGDGGLTREITQHG